MNLSRRRLLAFGALAAPAVIVTPGLLMRLPWRSWGYKLLPDGRLMQWGVSRSGETVKYHLPMDGASVTVTTRAGGDLLVGDVTDHFVAYAEPRGPERIEWQAVGLPTRRHFSAPTHYGDSGAYRRFEGYQKLLPDGQAPIVDLSCGYRPPSARGEIGTDLLTAYRQRIG